MEEQTPHTWRTLVFSLVTLILLLLIVFGPLMRSRHSILAREAYELLRRDTATVVLDVRTAEEFHSSTGRLERSLLMPLQDIPKRIGELSPYKERTILVYCRSGVRSRNAVTLLGKFGFKAINLEGGILEWSNQGLPVVAENRK